MTLEDWIRSYRLRPHPEGGFFRELYRSGDLVELANGSRFPGPRSAMTHIYYLLPAGTFSAFHRIRSDELWHYYAGDPVQVTRITPHGRRVDLRVGPTDVGGEALVQWVPAGDWFAARSDGTIGHSLVGCTVAPGFAFEDFELGDRAELIRQFPHHRGLILELTRNGAT